MIFSDFQVTYNRHTWKLKGKQAKNANFSCISGLSERLISNRPSSHTDSAPQKIASTIGLTFKVQKMALLCQNFPELTRGLSDQNINAHAQNQSDFLRLRFKVIVKVKKLVPWIPEPSTSNTATTNQIRFIYPINQSNA